MIIISWRDIVGLTILVTGVALLFGERYVSLLYACVVKWRDKIKARLK